MIEQRGFASAKKTRQNSNRQSFHGEQARPLSKNRGMETKCVAHDNAIRLHTQYVCISTPGVFGERQNSPVALHSLGQFSVQPFDQRTQVCNRGRYLGQDFLGFEFRSAVQRLVYFAKVLKQVFDDAIHF